MQGDEGRGNSAGTTVSAIASCFRSARCAARSSGSGGRCSTRANPVPQLPKPGVSQGRPGNLRAVLRRGRRCVEGLRVGGGEGYMDVVALAAAWLCQCGGHVGHGLHGRACVRLFRFTDRVVFSFDGDAAGRAAARALEAALPRVGYARSDSCSSRPSTIPTRTCARSRPSRCWQTPCPVHPAGGARLGGHDLAGRRAARACWSAPALVDGVARLGAEAQIEGDLAHRAGLSWRR